MNAIDRLSEQTATTVYRGALADDVPAMADLFLTAVSDMFARNSVGLAIPPKAAVIDAYEHVLASGFFRVAERDGRIVGIAGAVMRDDLWYLSAFWVLPEYQNRNVGMPLLRQVWEAGQKSGARIGFTWSSVDITAMAAYLKLGLMPGYPIMILEGTPNAIQTPPADYRTVELEPGVAEAIDRRIRGTGREVDHKMWTRREGSARQVEYDGRVVGYCYAAGGIVGPAAWTGPQHATAVLSPALRDAALQASGIRLSVPGVNHAALKFALDAGLRLTGKAHLLATSPFGCMEQYLPSGPSLF
jgi:GNAT superfamily N-acetyltransferase